MTSDELLISSIVLTWTRTGVQEPPELRKKLIEDEYKLHSIQILKSENPGLLLNR